MNTNCASGEDEDAQWLGGLLQTLRKAEHATLSLAGHHLLHDHLLGGLDEQHQQQVDECPGREQQIEEWMVKTATVDHRAMVQPSMVRSGLGPGAAMAGSLSRMYARWTMAKAVQSTTYTIPAKPIESPLITEVTRYDPPTIEPTRPSRGRGGLRARAV